MALNLAAAWKGMVRELIYTIRQKVETDEEI